MKDEGSPRPSPGSESDSSAWAGRSRLFQISATISLAVKESRLIGQAPCGLAPSEVIAAGMLEFVPFCCAARTLISKSGACC